MSIKINVFSTRLFACQRRGCETEGVSIRNPLSLLRYLKNIVSAILFKSYKVAVVESDSLFVNSAMTPEKLELISWKDEPKALLKTKIEQIRQEQPNLRISFFKDKDGDIYSGYCSETKKCYYITVAVQKDDDSSSILDNKHSQLSHADNGYKKEHKKEPLINERIKQSEFHSSVNDNNQLPEKAENHNISNTDSDKCRMSTHYYSNDSVEDKKNSSSFFGEEDKATDKKGTEKLNELEHQEGDKIQKNNVYEVLKENETLGRTTPPEAIKQPKSMTLRRTNTDFVDAYKVFPEIYEIATSSELYKTPIMEERLEGLKKAYANNEEGVTLANYKQVVTLYYLALIENSNKKYLLALEKLVTNMESSLSKSKHDFQTEVRPLHFSVGEEVIHGYLSHNPEVLRKRLSTLNEKFDKGKLISQEVDAGVIYLPLRQLVSDVLFKVNDAGHKRIFSPLEDKYTGAMSGRVCGWHYDFGKMYQEIDGSSGFSHLRLLEDKKQILGEESWDELEDLSEKMNGLDIDEFKKETKYLLEMTEEKDDKKSPMPLNLYNINAMIEKLEASSQPKEKALLKRLKSYKENLSLIAKGRHMLFYFEQEFYSRWDKSILLKELVWTEEEKKKGLHTCFKKITEIDELTDQIINDAQIDLMVNSHNKAKKTEMEVCIEGAGPSGLMCSISQYMAGANVSLFEKRNTDYNRVQIVRLDPKTMSWLKFHLPQAYVELFPKNKPQREALDHENFGTIKSDGYGLITINQLEDKLHKQVTKLSSASMNKNGKQELERFAMAEVIDVMIDSEGKSYCLVKKSPFHLDVDTVNLSAENSELVFEKKTFDLLLCAGGKSSTVVNTLEPVNVTIKGSYGVCTWDLKSKSDEFNEFNEFDDFRSVLVLDKLFEDKLNEQFNDQLSVSEQKVIFGGVAPLTHLLEAAKGVTSENVDKEKEYKISEGDGQKTPARMLIENIKITLPRAQSPVLQTRLFENNKRFYIGMEVPRGYEKWSNKVLEKLDAEQKIIAGQMLRKCWFQAVANYYGLDNNGATTDRINTNFASQFQFNMNRVKKSPFQLGEGLIIGVGDASCTPHFMTGYGLTGVRGGVQNAETLTKKLMKLKSGKIVEDEKGKQNIIILNEYVKEQCELESVVVRRGKLIIDHWDAETDDEIHNSHVIKGEREAQIRLKNNERVAKEKNTDYLKKLQTEYQKSLAKLKELQQTLIGQKELLLEQENGIQEKIKHMNSFLYERKNIIKKHSKGNIESLNKKVHVSEKNTTIGFSGKTEDVAFVQSIIKAENITDKIIDSLIKKYLTNMKSGLYTGVDSADELDSFWGMSNNDELTRFLKKALFDAIKKNIETEDSALNLILNNKESSQDDVCKAKRKLDELMSFVAIFWPKESNRDLLDVTALNQNDEFNDMAEYLFNIRWAKREDKVGISLLINNRKPSPYIIEFEQLEKRVEQFTSCDHGDRESGELKLVIHKMDLLFIEGRRAEVENKDRRIRSKICLVNNELGDYFIDMLGRAARGVIGGMHNKIGEVLWFLTEEKDVTFHRPTFTSKQLEKEINLLASTLSTITRDFLEENVRKQSNESELEAEIGSALCQEFIHRKIEENRKIELRNTINRKQVELIGMTSSNIISCKMADEIMRNLWKKISQESEFWRIYTKKIVLDNKVNTGKYEEPDINELDIFSRAFLVQINFLLEAASKPDYKLVYLDDSVKDLFEWSRGIRKGFIRSEHTITPAVLGNDKRIISKGAAVRLDTLTLGILP